MIPEHANSRKPTIGLTPLIDVVFILLIFFMLVIHFKQFQQMPLVSVKTAEVSAQYDQNVYVIRLEARGKCQLRNKNYSCPDAIAAIPLGEKTSVILGFSDTVTLGDIVSLQDSLLQAGHTVSLGLKTEASN